MSSGVNMRDLWLGCVKAIGLSKTTPNKDWYTYFDLSRRGLQYSLIALLLSMVAYYVGVVAVETHRAELLDIQPATIRVLPFILVSGLYAFSFMTIAYILSLVFDKQDRFRSWVIVRHWSVFFCTSFVAVLFALYLYTPLPFGVANMTAFIVFLGLLALDIRLAQKIAGFDWGGAMLVGCVVHAYGLLLLVAGLFYLSG